MIFTHDFWQEIMIALRRNRLRTLLTGFAIAWGIFMLILLMSAGNGFMNGMLSNFESRSTNIYTLYGGHTSKPYRGQNKERSISFTDADIRLLSSGFPHVCDVTPELSVSGQAVFGNKARQTTLNGVTPIYKDMSWVKMIEGRFINENDVKHAEKVIVIDDGTKNDLFRDQETAIGQYLFVNDIAYKVIGVAKGFRQSGSRAFTAYTTLKHLTRQEKYWKLSFSTEGLMTEAKNKDFENFLRRQLAGLHEYAPDDDNAVWINSTAMNFIEVNRIFATIKLFIWLIGIAMLVSGIVGVSNIMRITVKERTNEIGIRKALGAKSSSILSSIVMEALLITTLFGYIGMMAGISVSALANSLLGQYEVHETNLFMNPSVDMRVVALATLVLIVSGIMAGFFPARKAVKVKPIEAMTYR